MNKLFCIICIIVFLFKTETVFSKNTIYDVDNIKVSGRIDNNLDRKKLIQDAFQKAFTLFVNKTLLNLDAESLYETKISIIEDLIFTYQITKNIRDNKKKNFLTINIKFDQKKVNRFLAKKRIPYADISNISLTLLPVLIKEKETLIYGDNFFYNNWNKSDNVIEATEDKLISYNLALENVEDLEYINNNKENLELIDVKKITSLYGEKNYAFLIIYFKEDKLRAYVKTYIGNKEIDKNIKLNIYPKNNTKTYQEAILTLKEEINQIWKGQNLIDVSTPSFLDLFLDVKKVDDYSKISSIFDSIDLIENYSVSEMTNKYIKIRLRYKGRLNKLNDKLFEKKINIKITDNEWRVRLN